MNAMPDPRASWRVDLATASRPRYGIGRAFAVGSAAGWTSPTEAHAGTKPPCRELLRDVVAFRKHGPFGGPYNATLSRARAAARRLPPCASGVTRRSASA
jgi:hypothetical protein